MGKVQEFTLPPHSYVTVLAHDEPQEDGHLFEVINHGKAHIIAEAIHEGADDDQFHLKEVPPSESVKFTHDKENYKKSVLKVTNPHDHEVTFSASGGKLTAEDVTTKVKKMMNYDVPHI